ncbi:MAG: hypothetical protein PHD07_06630 [Bacteroidales bacterium]|nr:hypothetical protein [Bacteroidales bacterium]MDD3200744.1 hypothetical protein [Bacteroidales bacterium]
MKNLLLLLTVILAGMFFASCDQTCVCTVEVDGEVIYRQEYDIDVLESVKEEDISFCKKYETNVTVLGETYGTECQFADFDFGGYL